MAFLSISTMLASFMAALLYLRIPRQSLALPYFYNTFGILKYIAFIGCDTSIIFCIERPIHEMRKAPGDFRGLLCGISAVKIRKIIQWVPKDNLQSQPDLKDCLPKNNVLVGNEHIALPFLVIQSPRRSPNGFRTRRVKDELQPKKPLPFLWI